MLRSIALPSVVGFLFVGAGLTPAMSATAPEDVVASTPAPAATFNGDVRALAVRGNTVYVGGTFTRATDASGTVRRRNIAAVDATTGQLLAWNPGADGAVDAIAVTRFRVYLGGEFEHVAKGVARRHLAALQRGTGRAVRGWRFDANRFVKAIAVTPRGLYVGGGFTTIGDAPRQRLALVGSRDRLAPRWKPTASDTVLALAAAKDRIYVGGLFRRLNGQRPAGKLAALTPRTGRVVTGFHPDMRLPVHGLRLHDQRVYAGADGPGGRLLAFGPMGRRVMTVATDGAVSDLAIMDDKVYFGGHFDHVCLTSAVGPKGGCVDGQANRGKLAAVNLNGRLRPWNPDANSLVGAHAIRARDGQIFAGGGWTTLNGGAINRPHFARFVQSP